MKYSMTVPSAIPLPLQSQLRWLKQPAWLIKINEARMLWANAAGQELWGVSGAPPVGGWHLEEAKAALPHLAALQKIANSSKASESAAVNSAAITNIETDDLSLTGSIVDILDATSGKKRSCRCRFFSAIDQSLVLVTILQPNQAAEAVKATSNPRLLKPELRASQCPEFAQPGWAERSTDEPQVARAAIQIAKEELDGACCSTAKNEQCIAIEDAEPVAAPTNRRDVETLQEIARLIREDHEQDPSQQSLLKVANSDSDLSLPLRGTTKPTLVHSSPGPDNPIKSMPQALHQPNSAKAAKLSGDEPLRPRNEPLNSAMAKLAHELRTPISAIHTAAAILSAQSFGPIGDHRYKTYARDIGASAAHALDVIAAMLSPECIETGRPPLDFTELELDEIVEETLSGIRPLAEKASLTIASSIMPNLPHVIADARSIRQILLNLLTNAIKFTPAGGHVSITIDQGPDARLQLIVQDSGPGMSTAQIQDIMSRATTSAAPRPTATGQGIGLPLILSLARANNAAFDLTAKSGEGLRATITFAKDHIVPAW